MGRYAKKLNTEKLWDFKNQDEDQRGAHNSQHKAKTHQLGITKFARN